jgi:hypothetical protein
MAVAAQSRGLQFADSARNPRGALADERNAAHPQTVLWSIVVAIWLGEVETTSRQLVLTFVFVWATSTSISKRCVSSQVAVHAFGHCGVARPLQ